MLTIYQPVHDFFNTQCVNCSVLKGKSEHHEPTIYIYLWVFIQVFTSHCNMGRLVYNLFISALSTLTIKCWWCYASHGRISFGKHWDDHSYVFQRVKEFSLSTLTREHRPKMGEEHFPKIKRKLISCMAT